MSVFYDTSRGLLLTLIVIIIVTLLVLLEKSFAPKVKYWGDFYPALLSFLIISTKIAIPLLLLWSICGLSPRSLGWVKGGLAQALWKGVVLAVLMMTFMMFYQKFSSLVFHTPYRSTGERFLAQHVSIAATLIALSASLLNACGEEIIFRGMLLPVLSGYVGVVLALVIQSCIFTAYHFFPLQNSVLLFIMGIFFGIGYLWSGSLLTPVLAHLIENGVPALIFLIRILQSGHDRI
jgi:membrane protease YdiL (CAAX protease family)